MKTLFNLLMIIILIIIIVILSGGSFTTLKNNTKDISDTSISLISNKVNNLKDKN